MKIGLKNSGEAEELLFSYFEGSLSQEEQDKIQQWLEQDMDNRRKYNEVKVLYHWFKYGNKPGILNKEDSWNRTKTAYYKSRFRAAVQEKGTDMLNGWTRFAVPFAAAVVLAFFAGFFVHLLIGRSAHGISKPAYCEVYVPLGSRSQITLPDNSRVWLNANSRLRYPEKFGESREVSLEGEAYFDVDKKEDKVFVVNTSDVRVKAYGTQFNVKSYTDEDVIQATLIEGSISVEPIKGKAGGKTVFLKPNQSISYYKTESEPKKADHATEESIKTSSGKPDEKMVIIPGIDPLTVTSWKDNKWVIKAESLENLAVKLERRYNVKIFFQDESLKKYKFSGVLEEETFEQVLKILQISMPVAFTMNDNRVTLSEDKAFKAKYDTMIQNPKK